ncbi:MFS transporter [Streptomyces marincola]|uniref:MFS transporter n=1 Tax=Streptomyces marincola TaxID=2878388 RepID=UPI001CF25BB6|nr:MFS transporter [Streptomyces marincola]UCM89259.1 MFS transporter [Streptomyces marincola]
MVATGLAIFMTTFDMTAVAIALPDLNRELSMSPHEGEWLILAYAGAMVALGLPAGRYVDTSDIRGCFTVGALGFAAASALAGFAVNLPQLMGARLLQGAFGALVAAAAPVIAARSVPPEQRGRALSIIGVLGPLGAVSGPALGGPLVDQWGWQSVFFVVVPFSLAAVAVGMRHLAPLAPMRAPTLGLAAEGAMAAAGTLSVLACLTLFADPDPAYPLIAGLAVAAVLSFFAWRRTAGFTAVRDSLGQPMVAACVLSLTLTTVASGTLYYLPPFALGEFRDWSTSTVGLLLLFQPLAMGAIGPVSGWLVDKWKPRATAAIGLTSMTIGAVLLMLAIEDWPTAAIVAALLLCGLGLGLFAGPNQTLLMMSAPPRLRGTSAALSGTGRQLGLALGPALATIIWQAGARGGSDDSGAGMVLAFIVAPLAVACALGAFLSMTRDAGPLPTRPPGPPPGAPAQAETPVGAGNPPAAPGGAPGEPHR